MTRRVTKSIAPVDETSVSVARYARGQGSAVPPAPSSLRGDVLKEAQASAAFIARVQRSSGMIPWEAGGTSDPWNQIEAAMGLAVSGYQSQAAAAYRALAARQRPDGSLCAKYGTDDHALDDYADTNFVAYLATGVWHLYLVTNERQYLEQLFPAVERALNFVCAFQTPSGHIPWAITPQGEPYADALLAGSSSVLLSLACGERIARTLGETRPAWRRAHDELRQAIRSGAGFDLTWPSKERFAMDWFYPVLSGALDETTGRARLQQRWEEFVVDDQGCRCVRDEPWVTVAESAELAITLVRAGERPKAERIFRALAAARRPDGAYWTGKVLPTGEWWPSEATTWTAGAVILAADALYDLTGGARLFRPFATDE